ncbi:MAG: hypothetical protein U9O24_08245 [Campylobacterota bacterium]|nr:hypothetical protein [Campylobacterota bacterium]
MQIIVYFLILNTLLFAEGFGIPMYQTKTISHQAIQNFQIQEQRSIEALERQTLLEQLINEKTLVRIQQNKTQVNIENIEKILKSNKIKKSTDKKKLKELLKKTKELEAKQQATIEKIDNDISNLQKRSL